MRTSATCKSSPPTCAHAARAVEATPTTLGWRRGGAGYSAHARAVEATLTILRPQGSGGLRHLPR
eukprot:scaffold71285_cov36-Phaeocystis_antarctica.AAC.1